MTRPTDATYDGENTGDSRAGSPTDDWAMILAARPPLANAMGIAPAQDWLLTFRDPSLEAAFRQFEFERSKTVIVCGLGLGVLVLLAFLFLDRRVVPAEHYDMVTHTRLGIVLPAALTGFVGCLLISQARLWVPLVSWLQLIGGLWPSLRLLLSNGDLQQTASIGLWNMVIVTFFICGLPLRRAAALCLVFGSAFAVSSMQVQIPTQEFTLAAVNFVLVFVFCTFAVYRYERATRQQFLAQGMAQVLAERQLAAEAQRRGWLEVMAAFLRHELNNAMTAVSSSVDLAERAQDGRATAKFLGRARRSTSYMRGVLAQVADATSLESALARRSLERCDVAALVHDKVADFEQDHALMFTVSVEAPVVVRGNLDALGQMLDKLINNAMEHGTQGRPIAVTLQRCGGVCELGIANYGDELPADVERLFKPFISVKGRSAHRGNLGLGLFVARTIAAHHGGTVTAEPLRGDTAGARFIVTLPLDPAAD